MKKAKRKSSNPFVGYWRIVSMSEWNEGIVHEDGEGHFKFSADESGDFHFADVYGEMDYRVGTRDGITAIEFS